MLPLEQIKAVTQLAERSHWSIADVFAHVLESLPEHAKKAAPTKKRKTNTQEVDPSLASIEHRFADERRVKNTPIGPLTEFQKGLEQQIEQGFTEGGTTLVEASGIDRLVPLVAACRTLAEKKEGMILVAFPDPRRLERAAFHQNPSSASSGQTSKQEAVLEAPERYVCLRSVEQLRKRKGLTEDELHTLARILLWVPVLRDGRFSEIGLSGRPASLEYALSAAASGCGTAHAETEQGIAGCPWPQALAQAEKAHLVFVSHELLVRLPEEVKRVPFLAIDESEALPHILSERLTRRWSSLRARQAVQQACSGHEQSAQEQEAEQRLLERIELFFGLVGAEAAHERSPDERSGTWSARITKGFRLSGTYWKLEKAAENLAVTLEEAARKAHTPEDGAGLLDCAAFLREVFIAEPSGNVSWIEMRDHGRVGVAQAPIHIAPLLQEVLWTAERKASVLVGDVLFENGDPETAFYLRDQLGLPPETHQEQAASSLLPAEVFIHTEIPEPGQPGYAKALSKQVALAAEGKTGGVVVLTTSQTTVRAIHRDIALSLQEKGIRVVGQGVTGGFAKARDLFRGADGSVVFLGGMEAWSRVDFPAGSVRTLIIARLPFGAPSRPLATARNECYPPNQVFLKESLPEALLLYRRGIERMLQAHHPDGVRIILFDARVKTRDYGAGFLDVLRSYPSEEGDEKAAEAFMGDKGDK